MTPWFWRISRLMVLLETHHQNKRFLKWCFTCLREISLRFLKPFFSIYFEQTKTGNSETVVFRHIFFLQTSSAPQMTDSQVTSTAARQRKWCLDPCRMLPGRGEGFLNPPVIGGSRGSLTIPNIQRPLKWCLICFTIGELKTILFVETCWKCEMGWQGFFSEPNQKRSKFR